MNGNGDYDSDDYTTTAAGTYYWIASYGGDDNNDPVTGECGDAGETVVIDKDSPSISTTASGDVVVGNDIHDTATLSGGYNPTGPITFRLYSDDECENEVDSSTATVNGNGDYDSDDYTTTAAGTYYWIASYGGDDNNDPVTRRLRRRGRDRRDRPGQPVDLDHRLG